MRVMVEKVRIRVIKRVKKDVMNGIKMCIKDIKIRRAKYRSVELMR
jgi:hypothetical protein